MKKWSSLCRMERKATLWEGMKATSQKEIIDGDRLADLPLIPSVRACYVSSDSVQPYGPSPARLLCPWDSPGKNIGVGCQALLQGIFLTQGSNPCPYVS